MNRPQTSEFAEFYQKYIDTVNDNVMAELHHQAEVFPGYIRSFSIDQACYAYDEGKWTIKELLGHLIDTERIMGYRLLRIARNDNTPLPGFEENSYVENARFADRSLESLSDEFLAVRKSNLFLVDTLNEEEIGRIGFASNHPISVRALLFILAGHLNHHKKIIEERYLKHI